MHERNVEFTKLLVQSGWNQPQAERELGISQATISRYLAGKIIPRLAHIIAFKRALSKIGPGRNPEEERILAVIRKLPAKRGSKIIGALTTLLEEIAGDDVATTSGETTTEDVDLGKVHSAAKAVAALGAAAAQQDVHEQRHAPASVAGSGRKHGAQKSSTDP